MKEIIINQPHLQSLQQKLGSAFLSAMSWLLWLYFLLPLFTLGGWLMGVKSWSDEIRWFGGYKTLLQLLQMYAGIIIVIALLWVVWTFFLSWLHVSTRFKNQPPVSEQVMADHFKLDVEQLLQAKAYKTLLVHFDDHADITKIDSNDEGSTNIN